MTLQFNLENLALGYMSSNPENGGEEGRTRGGIFDFIKSLAGVLLILEIVSKYCYAIIRGESIYNALRDINFPCYIFLFY